ncbi:hypothetical protein FACS1894216_22300 [Synergistales bacterium]|nr:hypothetical protein FACS1894216_22300 [Synergistales bacterium]
MPSLLPGINFLFGLAGETRESLELNRDFLLKLMDEGLSARRINIRRAILFKGSELERRLSGGTGKKAEKNGIKDRDYMKWKDWVREEIDPVMLERVAPNGTIIRNIIAEERKGNIVFGRPLGSYPPLVGVISGRSSAILPNDKIDAMVTGRGGRSLTAAPYPLDINSCGRAELMSLPEIGKARAEALILRRPYNSPNDIIETMNAMDTPKLSEKLMRYFTER